MREHEYEVWTDDEGAIATFTQEYYASLFYDRLVESITESDSMWNDILLDYAEENKNVTLELRDYPKPDNDDYIVMRSDIFRPSNDGDDRDNGPDPVKPTPVLTGSV